MYYDIYNTYIRNLNVFTHTKYMVDALKKCNDTWFNPKTQVKTLGCSAVLFIARHLH